MIEKELKQIFPNCRHPADWVRPLNDAMARFEIDRDVRRVAAFLGQIGVESAQLNVLEEKLSYSPQRIIDVWPLHFTNLQDAMKYARNPERLGNFIYANRLGNGEERTGDGYRYRGRGLIQVTGRANYQSMSQVIPGLVEMPDYLLQPKYAAISAAAYWQQRGLNEIADKLGDKSVPSVVKTITKIVNGGAKQIDDRIAITKNAIEILDTEFAV